MTRILTIFALAALASCAAPDAPPPAARTAAPPADRGFVMPEGYEWSHGHGPDSQKLLAQLYGVETLPPNEWRWSQFLPDEGDARVIIDLKTQMAYAYKGEMMVGASSISSGRAGHETPLGVWPILSKHKDYRSRKYDNAPMPYFQRTDEFYIGIHGGHNPGHPASHGCVRVPTAFAAKLFALTQKGDEVIIEG